MADPQSYRPRTADIPTNPGVYRFFDPEGRIIYVGKAKNLRNRLTSYFRDPAQLHPRTRQMVFTACEVQWVVVASELEALTLEYAWIKEYNPRYNVMYRDDKSYPYLAVTLQEEYPRLWVTRDAHQKGNKYYGPYTQVRAVRDSLDLLLRVFPVRSCSKGVFKAAQRSGRPCLNGYIEKCVAPCVKPIPSGEYQELVHSLVSYLDSNGEELIADKTRAMEEASAQLEFELAAKYRDQILALRTISERNTVVLDKSIDADIFGLEFDELDASVQVFYVRAGRVRGQRGWITETSGLSQSELLQQLIMQVYGVFAQQNTVSRAAPSSVDDVAHTALQAIPRQIWLPEAPADEGALLQWLQQLKGAAVQFVTPQRGAKASLLDTVQLNAKQALQRHKIHRSNDITQRSLALEELRSGLQLARAPLRIECFDISHTQGTHQVGSMVVFEDGVPKKADYRIFHIQGEKGVGALDDTSALAEVLRRRLSRLKEDLPFKETTLVAENKPVNTLRDEPGNAVGNNLDNSQSHSTKDLESVGQSSDFSVPKFAYRPDLLVVDGGLAQVNAAYKVVQEFAADIAVIGLAKRLEEIWLPETDFPVILSRTSPALYMLQFLRDESHRFAITHHRKKRTKAMTVSRLDTIPGLGQHKQKALLRHFKSVKQIQAASVTELTQVPGIGPKLAAVIFQHLQEA